MAARARADYDYLIKLLLIGDSGVGKSCLLLRFSDGSFTTSFITTIGIDFKIRTVELDGKRIKLQIWDTAGQERFRTITTAYYRGAMGILLVYDVTDESSFNNIRNWIRNIEQHASDNVNKILVGNKADMDESKRAVPTSKGQALADEYGIKFFETSAKTNLNVEEVFLSIARDIKQRLADTDSKPESITLEAYPSELSLTAWICLLGTVEGGIVALVMERGNPSIWSLTWDTRLLAAMYSGVVCSGLAYYIQGVVMRTRGPVFVTAFSPLCMVIVAILGSFILAEQMFLGRVIGAIIIIFGLYLVVWGKSKDYNSPRPISIELSPINEEHILPTKQVVEEGNVIKEHFDIIVRDEQV
ncbi:hypothetical protein TanjilG_28318 [Lupinus angustifolius]|uniref:EamA domain-containing protein n=1 Tax=Lupinus angustifolius TaxID=3871 RepID=A0A4P1RI22_LUPAN|nr:hypothetical protein TanjilG_28318 [Lupinus angustifolius]